MCEDPVHEGYRVALRHRDEDLERVRRYTHALSNDLDPVRHEVAVELVDLLGVPCLSCEIKCVNGPMCETCMARQELDAEPPPGTDCGTDDMRG